MEAARAAPTPPAEPYPPQRRRLAALRSALAPRAGDAGISSPARAAPAECCVWRSPAAAAEEAEAPPSPAPPYPTVQQYLERIGLAEVYPPPIRPPPTAETLRTLHEAHQLHVPFENFDIYPGAPRRQIVLDEARIVDKIVRQRRGGFCYELNSAFGWLCRQLGFRVERMSARMNTAVPDVFGPPFDHLCLRVDDHVRIHRLLALLPQLLSSSQIRRPLCLLALRSSVCQPLTARAACRSGCAT